MGKGPGAVVSTCMLGEAVEGEHLWGSAPICATVRRRRRRQRPRQHVGAQERMCRAPELTYPCSVPIVLGQCLGDHVDD